MWSVFYGLCRVMSGVCGDWRVVLSVYCVVCVLKFVVCVCGRVAPQSQNQIGADSKITIFAFFWSKNPSN